MTKPLHFAPSIAHVLGLPNGERTTAAIRPYRVNRRNPCPVCGSDSECITIPQASMVHVWCTRVASETVQTWGIKGSVFYHRLDGNAHATATTYQRREYPLADQATQHRALLITAQVLGLCDAHRAKLQQRGYAEGSHGADATYTYLFCSLPADPAARAQVAMEVMRHFIDAEAVLGYHKDYRRGNDSPIYFLPNVEGAALVEFRRDELGSITGYEYDPDMPTYDSKGKRRKHLAPTRMIKAGKYHVARPATPNGEVWHAEGIHKANLLAQGLCVVAVTGLGVGNHSGHAAAALALDTDRALVHVVAVDADKWQGKDETAILRTLHEAGYQTAIARWDATLGNGPDDALLNGAEFSVTPHNAPKGPPHRDTRIIRRYPWQDRPETPAERQAMLRIISDGIRDRVKQHIDRKDGTILTVAAPPGVGKSHSVSELGAATTASSGDNLGWIAQRHEMVSSVPALQSYRHIQPPTQHNCGAHILHEILSRKGYNTHAVHSNEVAPCLYSQQFRATGSAVYQILHVPTKFVLSHAAIIIDELDLTTWAGKERTITIGDLSTACNEHAVDSTTDLFLRNLQATITDFGQEHQQTLEAKGKYTCPTGKAIFDRLNARCNGQLTACLGTLDHDADNRNERPWADFDPNEIDAQEHAESLHKVVMPHVLRAFMAELVLWQSGQEWASRIRIGKHFAEMALHLTEPLKFSGATPPVTVLDATTDAELMENFWDKPITIERIDVDPPPHMQHIAIRSGKRYGKKALESEQRRELARAIAEIRHVLADLDPNGAKCAGGKVGLITFTGIEQEMREALGIPESCSGHFWGMRGSNRMEACEILLIVGTPAQRPDQVMNLARSLYFGEAALDPTYDEKTHQYADPRLQHLADYLIRSELTQCAHRNRALRHDGRIVISFCNASIDFLPITTEIIAFPQLATDGEALRVKREAKNHERLLMAWQALQSQEMAVSANALAKAAKMSKNAACAWMRANGHNDMPIAEAVSKVQLDLNCKTDTALAIQTPLDTPLSSAESPPPDDLPWTRWQRVEYWQRRGYREAEAIRKEREERNDYQLCAQVVPRVARDYAHMAPLEVRL